MAVSNQLKNQHLLWRAAFGPMAENVNELTRSFSKRFVSASGKNFMRKNRINLMLPAIFLMGL